MNNNASQATIAPLEKTHRFDIDESLIELS